VSVTTFLLLIASLLIAAKGLQAGLITPSFFSIVILISLETTLITPWLLKLVYLIPTSAAMNGKPGSESLLAFVEHAMQSDAEEAEQAMQPGEV
jgi:hypothetical protein